MATVRFTIATDSLLAFYPSVLESPPIKSALDAVKAAIVAEVKKGEQ